MLDARIPRHVHHRAHRHGGVVLLNIATGTWHALNPSAGALWTRWAQGVGFESSVIELADRHPEVSPEKIREEAGDLLRDLLRRGLLEPAESGVARRGSPQAAPGRAVPSPSAAVTTALGPSRRPAAGATLLAGCCLLVSLLLLRLPFRITTAVVARLRQATGRREMTVSRAESAAMAVRHVARRYPGRAACLETSLATVLFAAASLRRLDWCLGAATDPYRFHAWAELDGHPIATDPGHLRVLTL
ncbi:lasso peptide biosynthesis B2 protein [Nonomuraea diastatica]|uniref:Lasso peptide biosynthesis B2 protein n=1 Tax=Nonomuraea diastatica TaxID=1848329 RepID=A0A4R4X3R1_9ACTN|nr:lasso peptide biosynthesis B2 protein [Nonomuraea diastatica]TDD24884.1 lasso peptide biosynthesis B2 protein [Nonomuraea diastatica]